MLEKRFHLKERGTTVKTEIIAGFTSFMTMAYILAVHPGILAAAGMDATAVLLATCITSFIGTLGMALIANLPFAISTGMGINAYLAYTVVLSNGASWQTALLAVFCEGVIFIIMTLTGVREAIVNCIPLPLKHAVSVGIGLFICFIGLQDAGLSVASSTTLVEMVSFRTNFSTAGIQALLAAVGILLTAVLFFKKVPGSILIGILCTWGLGILCQFAGIYVPDADAGYRSLLPTFQMTDFSRLGETFGKCFEIDAASFDLGSFGMILLSFLFVDTFNTLGSLVGVGARANMLDENGKLPTLRPALLSDAIATTAGAVLGTSTTTTFAESAAGVAAGGRTGLTALTTAVLFLLSMFLAPIFTAIPAFATAPALLIVGFLMFTNASELKFTDNHATEVFPAYLCIAAMPLFYSIADGIALGVISYVVLNACTGKARKINPIMYILCVLFILKYVIL